jgi:hypothetical protein
MMYVDGNCSPVNELHGTNRTPSNLKSPASVPIQMYPSVVCVIFRTLPPK